MASDKEYYEQSRLWECKKDVEKAFNESYIGYSLKIDYQNLINKWGLERLNKIFASDISFREYDGRIRQSVKDWSKNILEEPRYQEDSSVVEYYMSQIHAGLIDMAANNLIKIQKELPIIENLNGYKYQILMQEKDFCLISCMGNHPEYVVVSGLKMQDNDKFQWDMGQYFSNWDNAVSYYMDGVIDKPSEMKRHENQNNIEKAIDDNYSHFHNEDEDEDDLEL